MWLDALSIQQRHRLSLKRTKILRGGFFSSIVQKKRGKKKSQNWRKLRAFSNDQTKFLRSLKALGINEKELARILGSPAEALVPKGYQERWVSELIEIVSNHIVTDKSQALQHYEERGILNPYIPIIDTHYQALTKLLKVLPFSGQHCYIADLCLDSFLQNIEYNVRRAVILELNVKRVLGSLGNGSEAEQFKNFKDFFCRAENRLDFYQKYPLLSKYISITCKNWLLASKELIERLVCDWDLMVSTLNIPSTAKLSSIESGGDTHNGGRTVNILTFDGKYKVIYKPRSVRLEKEFFDYIGKLNKSNKLSLRFHTLIVIDRGKYGWVEFCSY